MLSGLRLRLEDRNLLTLVKLAEVRLLGRHASTWCYNRPSHVYLELTPRCNLRCAWCVQQEEGFRRGYADDMPFELFREIVAKLRGVRVLYLCLNGEPLLYPRLCDAVALAKQQVPSVRFVSNGTLLSRELGRELQRAGLSQLAVSIDSPDPLLMRQIRGVDLETVSENVEVFCRETGIPLEVRTTICRENAASLRNLPEFVRRFSTCRLIYFTLAEGLAGVAGSPLSMLESREEFRRLQRGVVRECRRLGIATNLAYLEMYPDGYFARKRQGICDSLFGRHLAINSKGYVIPCCRYWGEHLGNLGEVSFEQAWNGPLTRAWRRRMLRGEYTAQCADWCGYGDGTDESAQE